MPGRSPEYTVDGYPVGDSTGALSTVTLGDVVNTTWQLGAINFPAIPVAATILNNVKPPSDAYDRHGAKAPGLPGDAEGYCPPKGGPKWRQSPKGRGNGWLDADGNVWVPSGQGGSAHGGPHWDVQGKNGRDYENLYPGGKRR
nr:polymorphic toxin type 37 domain-containing protein [Stenotrophomonas sp. CFBP 13718]